MKINSLKINGFGKLVNKEIKFENGINIVYGKNEAGKSSLEKFMVAMLYGLSKLKNGKEISDFDRFKPWETDEFSGKLEYTLDNMDHFEVYREFKKKNPIIYNSLKEDISKQYNLSKNKGVSFFVEQTGIDENTFNSTAISEQEGLRLSNSSQNSILQKISNLIASGDDNISYKKVMDKLKIKQNQEVGTERTSQRPINIAENKLSRLIEEKKTLEVYKEGIFDSQQEKNDLKKEIKDEENKREYLKELRRILEEQRIKSAEINFNINLESEYAQKIEELNDRLEDNGISEEDKNNFKIYYIVILVCTLLCIGLMIWKVDYRNLCVLIPIIPVLIKLLIEKNKADYKKNQLKYERLKMTNELSILNQNREFQKAELEAVENKFTEDFSKEKDSLSIKYVGIIDSSFIDEFSNKTYKEVVDEIENKDNRINSIKFRIQTLEGRTREINNKIEELSEIEEKIELFEEELQELHTLNNSYNIARDCLEEAYTKVKENISPQFTQNLCEIISEISDGKYNNVMVNDTTGISVEIGNGSYVPATRLSVGTIDQMYLSLRLGSVDEISGEKLPIILDEAFAYFDEPRLINILSYLAVKFSKNQIIIFTCSNREGELLKRLKIKYNLVNL